MRSHRDLRLREEASGGGEGPFLRQDHWRDDLFIRKYLLETKAY